MKNITLDESRVYTENGKVKIKHLLLESANIDMSPHPTESRIFVKDGEVITVLSEEIQKKDSMSVEMAETLTLESIRKEYQLHGVQC